MNRIDQLRQQIDACRAGSDDLYRPELAELAKAMCQGNSAGDPTAADPAVVREFDRAQRFDQCVVSALHDVAVPPGLLQKLLAQASQPSVGQDAELLDDAVTAAAQSDLPLSSDEAKVAARTRSAWHEPPASARARRLRDCRRKCSGDRLGVVARLAPTNYGGRPRNRRGDLDDRGESKRRLGRRRLRRPMSWLLSVRDMRIASSAIARWRTVPHVAWGVGVVVEMTKGSAIGSLVLIINTPYLQRRPLPLTRCSG